jgi:hypothetical protein
LFVFLVGLWKLGYYQPSLRPTLKQALLTLAVFALLGTHLCHLDSFAGQAPETKPPDADKFNPDSYADPEAYAVYAAVLPKVRNWELHEPKSLFFQEETEFSATESVKQLCVKGGRDFNSKWGSTLKAYVTVNQIPRRLLRMFPIEKNYTLVPERELQDFYARYPEATSFVSMSSVGFNTEKNKALLKMTYYCGSLCMKGTYYLMEKKNGTWVRASDSNFTSCVWAS